MAFLSSKIPFHFIPQALKKQELSFCSLNTQESHLGLFFLLKIGLPGSFARLPPHHSRLISNASSSEGSSPTALLHYYCPSPSSVTVYPITLRQSSHSLLSTSSYFTQFFVNEYRLSHQLECKFHRVGTFSCILIARIMPGTQQAQNKYLLFKQKLALNNAQYCVFSAPKNGYRICGSGRKEHTFHL